MFPGSKYFSNQIVPTQIRNLTKLNNIIISNSPLIRNIFREITDLVNLSRLELGSNQLTGEIPSEIGNLVNLTHLNLFNNKLSGEIPSDIENLVNLDDLNISRNQLTGNIPENILDPRINLLKKENLNDFLNYENKIKSLYDQFVKNYKKYE